LSASGLSIISTVRRMADPSYLVTVGSRAMPNQ
jgi:hypothetical protein